MPRCSNQVLSLQLKLYLPTCTLKLSITSIDGEELIHEVRLYILSLFDVCGVDSWMDAVL